jgi:hypothetical protein
MTASQQETEMTISFTPVTDALSEQHVYVDNEMQDAIQQAGFFRALSRHGLPKRSGDPVVRILFAILVWPFLPVKSIRSFCGRFLSAYLHGGMQVVYRFLRREDINWRSLSTSVAKTVYKAHDLGREPESALVADDTLKHRRGRKVEGMSSHYDHTEGRHVMAQQVLQLGLASPKGFLPIEQQIYIGSSRVQGLQEPFADERSAVARDYLCAREQDKNQMLQAMLRRARRNGFDSKHLCADTWFATKGNIKAAVDLGLTCMFMMKRGRLTYRFQGGTYTATMLYQLVKRRMSAGKGQRFLTYSITAELNLTEDSSKPANWIRVRLVFSKLRRCTSNSWVLLLCTNPQYDAETILRVYALRWGIEVYFKEVKQNMGWLKEQTGRYAVHYASIHLAAIRYMLLFNLLLRQGRLTFGHVRDKLTGALQELNFAAVLWELFKALIHGALNRFEQQIGAPLLRAIKAAIDTSIEEFIHKALQLDEASVQAQLRAEALGAL